MDDSAALRQPPSADESPLEPLDVDGIGAVGVGTALWALALIGAVAFHDRLNAAGHGSWVWIAVAGTGLGLIALPYLVRRRSRASR